MPSWIMVFCTNDLIFVHRRGKNLTDYFASDTTPPKERVKDTSKDFYSAGFAPGAIVYFSYDLPKGLSLLLK